MGKVICPKCEKDDQIQKVSSIYSGGISTSNYESAYSSGTAVSQTALSRRLSPPAKPKSRKDAWREMASPSGFVAFIVLAAMVGCVASVAISPFDNFGAFVWVSIAGSLILIALAVYAIGKPESEILNWERKIEKFYGLYYCHRDDCVFDPQSGKYSSPQGMDRLL